MSSSSATAAGSRSPSPATPATPDSSDSLETIAFSGSIDLSTWYNSLSSSKPSSATAALWEDSQFLDISKEEDGNILLLEDILQEHAYDDTAAVEASTVQSSDSHTVLESAVPLLQPSRENASTSPRGLTPTTKPIPPPASQPRRRNVSAASQTVVYPPKESCYNLPIMIPSIPEGGTKSRVETQVRITVDLAHASSSTGEAFQYDRVGTYKWLQLPRGTATKRRTRKEGKIEPSAEDTLFLSAEVTCSSPPHMRVVCCSSCQTREAKRVARKLAARVRPQRSDGDQEACNSDSKSEGSFNIVQFNCPEVLDFSAGSVVLPLRITCYCRHHREKVGFNVHFTMLDSAGRVVGSGVTRPIMITDDHKSTGASASKQPSGGLSSAVDIDWSQLSSTHAEVVEQTGPVKRKYGSMADASEQSTKRARASTGRLSLSKVSRKSSSASLSPSTFASSLPTRTTTPRYMSSEPSSQLSTTTTSPPPAFDNFIIQNAETFLPSPSTSIASPGDHDTNMLNSAEAIMPNQPPLNLETAVIMQRAASPSTFLPTAPPSPAQMPLPHHQGLPAPAPIQSIPFMFFHADPPPMPTLPKPRIHRLIPSSGPTYGGIEVTILGSNFHPSLQLDCLFGEAMASSTQRWSDNTLVCILPPRICSGVVGVWFHGIDKDEDGTPPCLFTYTDESDRALMELALQVVGLKMTGKLEDAKSVAMRIVGPPSDDPQGGSAPNGMQQFLSNHLSLDLHPLRRRGVGDELEQMVLDLLSLLDVPLNSASSFSLSSAVSHQTHSGQTLLHLAVFLKYPRLIKFLLRHDIDIDVRDRNGYTALHFAGIVGARECATILIDAGADLEIVNADGHTAQEVSTFDFDDLRSPTVDAHDLSDELDEEESRWGDGEEESEGSDVDVRRRTLVKRRSNRAMNRAVRRSTGASASVSSEDDEGAGGGEVAVPDAATTGVAKSDEAMRGGAIDEKQALSFMDMIQRTLARVQPTQGLMPHLPNLPGMPAVPWDALPQIPMVFPVYVPWPAFLGEKRVDEHGDALDDGTGAQGPKGAARWTAQEWRAFWEKWMMQGTQAQAQGVVEDDPPPVYTPRTQVEAEAQPQPAQVESEEEEEEDEAAAAGPSTPERPSARRVGYDTVRVTDQEVNAYGYRPTNAKPRQVQKKEDRMLILFWIPILFLALVWALFSGVRIAFHSLRTLTPLKAVLRL